MMRAMRLLVIAILVITFTSVARAAEFEVRAHADPDVVEVGDAVRYVLEASSENDVPSDPKLGGANGFHVTGPSTSSTQSMSIVNGVVSQKRGISATWLLRPTREGTFTVGPATVRINGEKRAAQPVQVRVVGKGKAPKRRPDFGLGGMPDPFGQLPFDPFGGGGPDPFKGFFDDFRKGPAPNVVTADPKLSLDAPRGQGAFLHATVDKTHAVVGEQVTFTVLLYIDINEGDSSLRDGHEAPAADFLRKPLADVNKQNVVGYALIQGRPWVVRQIRKTALFPIKSGSLEIGRMSLMLASGRFQGLRETESLKVNVGEPPVKGRPHGYTVGDVGQFSLSAEVSPREVENGGALAVVIDLKGTGNLPAQINVPSSDRAEWLEPTVTEKLGPSNGDRYGGNRTFTYVVRVKQEGTLDLGELRLPFWNPDSRSYGIARAALGSVLVKPGVGVAAAPSKDVEMLPGLPAPLGANARVAKVAPPISDSPLFWVAWLVPPSLLLVIRIASALGARWRERQKRESASPRKDLADKQRELREVATTGDSRNIVGATLRFLEQAILVHAGLNVRGLLAGERQEALESASIFSEDAARMCELLLQCEQERFAPVAPDLQAVREAADQAIALVDRIAKTARPRASKKTSEAPR